MRGTSRHRAALLVAGLLSLAACETDQNGGQRPATGVTPASVTSVSSDALTIATRPSGAQATGQQLNMTFIDGDVFDKQLASSLARAPGQVRVDMRTPLGQVPNRMNTWFNAVADRGGKVETMTQYAWAKANGEQVAEVEGTRGMFLLQLLPFVFQLGQNWMREEATYGSSRNYDVILVTDNQRTQVQQIVFKHKNAP